MPLLPDATITIQDGGLGTTGPNASQVSLGIGACSRGVANQFYSHSEIGQMVTDLGRGPLAEARGQVLGVAGGPVYSVPSLVSNFGAVVGSVVHAGPGAGSVAVTLAPDRRIDAKITTAGALGTMAVAFSVGGGAYTNPILSTAGSFVIQVPGTICKLTFSAATYTVSDIYTVDTLGTVTVAGTGPSANVTQASSPLDKFDVLISVAGAGALGAATFTYAVDNNVAAGSQQIPTQSAVYQIPVAGKVAIPNTGIVLTFSGAFTAGDTYSFSTSAPSVINTDYMNALTAAMALPFTWFLVHLVGTGSNAAASASLFSALDAQLLIAEAANRYTGGMIQAPQDADVAGSTNTDAALQAAFVGLSSLRVGVCAADCRTLSAIDGRVMRRNAAYPVVARLSSIAPKTEAHDVGQGTNVPAPLKNVLAIYRDESVTPFLDALGFTTLRSFTGINSGYFVTRARIFAPAGSDFTRWSNRRVMDLACAGVRARAVTYVGRAIPTDKAGLIRESTAQAIEADFTQAAFAAVGDNAVDVKVTVVRNANILSTSTLFVVVKIRPYGYSDFVSVTIGFTNPALSTSTSAAA